MSRRSPLELENNRGADCYNSIFQNYLNGKIIHHYSCFTDKGPSIAERVIRAIRYSLKKQFFLAGNADWLSELPTAIKQYKNTIHSSMKITPNQTSKKANEKLVYSTLKDDREKQKPKYKLGQLVRSADIKRNFSKGDSTNYSYKLYTISEVIDETIPTYRIDYLHERYNQNLLLPTELSLEENNKLMKDLNLIQEFIN